MLESLMTLSSMVSVYMLLGSDPLLTSLPEMVIGAVKAVEADRDGDLDDINQD